jgi:hypothetical protein
LAWASTCACGWVAVVEAAGVASPPSSLPPRRTKKSATATAASATPPSRIAPPRRDERGPARRVAGGGGAAPTASAAASEGAVAGCCAVGPVGSAGAGASAAVSGVVAALGGDRRQLVAGQRAQLAGDDARPRARARRGLQGAIGDEPLLLAVLAQQVVGDLVAALGRQAGRLGGAKRGERVVRAAAHGGLVDFQQARELAVAPALAQQQVEHCPLVVGQRVDPAHPDPQGTAPPDAIVPLP